MIEPNYLRIKRIIEQFYHIDDMALRLRYPKLCTARQAYVLVCKQHNILNDLAIAELLKVDRTSIINMRHKAVSRITPINGRIPDRNFAIELTGLTAYLQENIPGLDRESAL